MEKELKYKIEVTQLELIYLQDVLYTDMIKTLNDKKYKWYIGAGTFNPNATLREKVNDLLISLQRVYSMKEENLLLKKVISNDTIVAVLYVIFLFGAMLILFWR